MIDRGTATETLCKRNHNHSHSHKWSQTQVATTMPTFQNKTFRSSADANKLGMRYRALMSKHPFLTFGLPFIAVIVAGSFVLTPATAIRYEKHDRKVRQMTKEEELNVRRAARKVDMKEEYYVSLAFVTYPFTHPIYLCRGAWNSMQGNREKDGNRAFLEACEANAGCL